MVGLNPIRLRRAARLWGVQPSYRGMDQKVVWAPEKTLCAVLGALTGIHPRTNGDVEELIERARREWIESLLPPSTVVRAEQESSLNVHVPLRSRAQTLQYELFNEEGAVVHAGEWTSTNEVNGRSRSTSSGQFQIWRCRLPALEPGYYTLRAKGGAGDLSGESLVIAASAKEVFRDSRLSRGQFSQTITTEKCWGLFTPIYALRRQGDSGIGDISHLRILQNWAVEWKCRWIGLLPIMSKAGMMETEQISPYSPQSRLFWNELFLDMEELLNHEEQRQTGLRDTLNPKDLENLFAPQDESEFVDYTLAFRRRKRILTALAEQFFRGNQPQEYHQFLKERPELADFAEYYSQSEQEFRYQLYTQYQMHRQLQGLKGFSQRTGHGGLYLDLPVGVQKDGFDFKKYAGLFADTLEVGSPPDMLFHAGQRWGFPPYHPIALRKSGFQYFRKMIRNHFKYADALRIDHVMGLYRIYVIPEGMESKDGCYIRLPFRELFAITRLEADLHGAIVIGEDLGTVPEVVREIMSEFHILRMWVVQIELLEKGTKASLDPPAESISSINTHDMPPWRAFQLGMDVELWRELGYYDAQTAKVEKRKRAAVIQAFSKSSWNSGDLYPSMIRELAESPARALILNLEDLWLEEQPQNIPGTWQEYPNWKHRHRLTMEDWMSRPEIQKAFAVMAKERK